jgi:cytochrome b561
MFDKNQGYGIVSKLLHWIRGILLITIFVLAKIGLEEQHMLLGLVLFIIIIVNIFWRVFNLYPNTDAASVPEKNIQFIIFFLIYLCCFIIPILGYLGVRRPMDLFVFTIYPIYEIGVMKDFVEAYLQMEIKSFTRLIRFIHEQMAHLLILILVVIHVLAVLFNTIIRKNNELKKML